MPADPDRRLLAPRERSPRLTGRASAPRRAARGGRRARRSTTPFDLGPSVRALVLDTVDRAGGSRGLLRPAQLALAARPARRAPAAARVLVFSHNPLDNTAGGEAALRRAGGDAAASSP